MKTPTRTAFTLIELMVVLSVILVLAAITLRASTSLRQKSLEDKTRADFVKIGDSCNEYKRNSGHMPIPVWPMLSGYGTLTFDQTLADSVGYNSRREYTDHWGQPYLYYPLPVAPSPGYPSSKKTILGHPNLSGCAMTDYLNTPSDTLLQKFYDRWMTKGSKLRDVGYILISGGPDRKIEHTTLEAILTATDFGDDICNFK